MNRGDQQRDLNPRSPDHKPGEGDGEPVQRVNEKQHTFVRTARGQRIIERAGEVDAQDERTVARAEASGWARARGEDSTLHLRKRDR